MAYQAIKPQIENTDEISVLFSHGSIYRHIGFSHKYFGKEKAIELALKYEQEMSDILNTPSFICDNSTIQ
jgi:hypothetical protein